MRWLVLMYGPLLVATVPRFDPTALLREVLVPADAAVGSVIYRLRASDPTFDFPLIFSVSGQFSTVSVNSLNCSKFNSVCQANVVLRKRLEAGRFYDFTVDVRNQRGETARLNCSIRATNATTPLEKIFPGAPSLLSISEKAGRNTELGTILVKGNLNKTNSVLLELWGSPEFGLHQKRLEERDAEGTVLLLSSLDYETKTVHHLTILANDPWTNIEEDTRNIAGWPLLVAVLDEQDTPPVFTIAPPTTTLSPSLQPGDLIVRVHAEDGDRGNPREIRYGLVADGNPFAKFFNITEDKGELLLTRPLSQILSISHTGQPILLTVTAEEVRSNPEEAPAQSSNVQLALIPPGVTAGLPTFGAIEYNALLDENSPTGTILDLTQAEINTQPGDVITLGLINNNGTFDISPHAVEGHATFQIAVHDPKLLDYEQRQSVQCYIVAKEIGAGNYTAKAKLTVVLNDVNDNPPAFTQKEFHGNVQEHANVGTTVLLVEATDVDREPGSKIKYTSLKGPGSELFNLDPDRGLITVANSQNLDAEIYPVLTLTVEAADENGKGLTATSTVIITLIDINDQIPSFEKSVYEFILNSDKISFTYPAIIKATDKDISPPNNVINYEIIDPPDNIYVNKKTGEIQVTEMWRDDEVAVLRGRVWDNGVPRLSSECEIRIYPPEGQTRKMVFIVPGKNLEKETVAQTLRALTGARVVVDRIRPYTGDEPGAAYVSKQDDVDKSVVEATITFSKGSVIDVNNIQKILDKENERNEYREKEIIRIKESSSGDLLWLLILFFILAIIAAIILILCCLCKQCPLYLYPKRRKQTPEVEKIEKIKIIGSGQGRESKSVQVAEWFGRREAWTPEHVVVDAEAESLRRHEVERGSDRGGAKRTIYRQSQIHHEPSRDHLYIREGNTDILRLITRGGEQQRPVTLVADQTYMADNGKDILMRRFIDQQQAEAAKAQVLLPNAVNRLQTEHELLEASLRQQNALLRQILLDRERDLRLETQSLPAGTQTDQDAGTQTEPQYLRPPQRKVRSDNDQSEASDDELAIIKARAKRRNGQKIHVRRKIRTPIQEETELEIIEKPQKIKIVDKRPKIKQTKTSELRQKRATSEARSSQSRSSKSSLRKEILREISASLEQSDDSGSEGPTYFEKGVQSIDIFSDDSLEISPRSEKTTDSGRQKYHSESDLRLVSSQSQRNSSEGRTKERLKSRSQTDLTKIGAASNQNSKKKKRSSRYMEWYNKSKDEKPKVKAAIGTKSRRGSKTEKENLKEETKPVEVKPVVNSRLLMDTESSSRKKSDSNKNSIGPEHPLLQHSEHRFEAQYPIIPNPPPRRPEDDTDSGIALTKPPMAQKKSVFTIAYDDMHTSQLRPDSTSPP